jgi:hypothetical protein
MPIPSYILPSAPAYTEDSVYALIPTPSTPIYTPDAISFTRGSDATRTASNGLIQRSPVNLLTYSEDLTNVNWSKAGQGVGLPPVVTGNQGLAPNGTMTADRVQFNCVGTTVSDRSYIIQAFTSATIGNRYTMSFYVKAFSISEVGKQLRCITENGGIPSTIITVTNDWQLVTIPATGNATTTTIVFLVETRGTNTVNTTADVLIWGAQLVEGSQPLTYFPTTDRLNVPRIDFSQGSCPALLLEPQRTNLALYSEQFDNAGWANGITTVVSANTSISPSGLTNADTATFDATTSFIRQITGAASIINGSTYTLSVYVKASASGGATNVRLTVNNTTTWTGAASTKVTLTSSWQRVTLTWIANGTQAYFIIGAQDTSGALDTSCYGKVDIWGAQLELGAYATTYIPTNTTSVTRLGETFTKSNIYTNGLITAAGGTWYMELRNAIGLVRDAFAQSLYISDTSSLPVSNGLGLRNGVGTSNLQVSRIVGGVETILGIPSAASTIKIAFKWNGSTADVFANGTKVFSAIAFTPTNMNFVFGNGDDVPKYIQSMALFSTPLSDATLITMTT